MPAGVHLEIRKGKVFRIVLPTGGSRESVRELHLVKRRCSCAFCRVDQYELGPGGCGGFIPETVVAEPRRMHATVQHQRSGVVTHELLRSSVISGAELRGLLGRLTGKKSHHTRAN